MNATTPPSSWRACGGSAGRWRAEGFSAYHTGRQCVENVLRGAQTTGQHKGGPYLLCLSVGTMTWCHWLTESMCHAEVSIDLTVGKWPGEYPAKTKVAP